MDYTEAKVAEFRKLFQVRRRKQILAALLFLLTLFVLAVVGKGNAVWGEAILRLGFFLPVTAMLATGILSFSLYNWRCPACEKSLGISVNPGFCRHCGIPL